MTKPAHTIVVLFDEPDCGGAADVLVSQIESEASRHSAGCSVDVKPLAVPHGNSHRDALYRALQDLFTRKHQDVYVICIMKGPGIEEYRRVTELCDSTKPPLERSIITCLGNYTDAGLTVRNLTRRVVKRVEQAVATA